MRALGKVLERRHHFSSVVARHRFSPTDVPPTRYKGQQESSWFWRPSHSQEQAGIDLACTRDTVRGGNCRIVTLGDLDPVSKDMTDVGRSEWETW